MALLIHYLWVFFTWVHVGTQTLKIAVSLNNQAICQITNQVAALHSEDGIALHYFL